MISVNRILKPQFVKNEIIVIIFVFQNKLYCKIKSVFNFYKHNYFSVSKLMNTSQINISIYDNNIAIIVFYGKFNLNKINGS